MAEREGPENTLLGRAIVGTWDAVCWVADRDIVKEYAPTVITVALVVGTPWLGLKLDSSRF